MLPILDVPMVERVLAHLGASGVTDAVLSLGYKPDVFLAAYPDGRCGGVGITYAVEPEPLDTAGGDGLVAPHRRGTPDVGVAECGCEGSLPGGAAHRVRLRPRARAGGPPSPLR